MQKILIAKISKFRGLKGQVKLNYFGQNLEHLKAGKTLFLKDDGTLKIAQTQIVGQAFYLNFENINTIEEANYLLGQELFVQATALKEPEKGEYYIKDLIDCEVFINDKKTLGKVVEVQNFGASDIFIIKQNKIEFLVPFVENLVLEVDLKNKKILFDEQVFEEVVV